MGGVQQKRASDVPGQGYLLIGQYFRIIYFRVTRLAASLPIKGFLSR
jgi:hypothetical protein